MAGIQNLDEDTTLGNFPECPQTHHAAGWRFLFKRFPTGMDWVGLGCTVSSYSRNQVAADRGNEMLLAGVDRLAVVRLIFALSISM